MPKDKLPQDVHSEVSDAVGELKKALEGTDIAPVKAAQEKLSEASQKIGQALYAHEQAQAASAAPSEAPASGAGEDDGIVDAEIVDDEDESK